MSSPICEECKRPTWVLSRCDICHRQVCVTCLRTTGSTYEKSVQVCRRCEQLPPKLTPVKALSGYAEWFWLMAKNWKPVENRKWPLTRYFKRSELPVRIYLHASMTVTPKGEIDFIQSLLTVEQRQEFSAVDWKKYRGHIIGEITITDEVTNDEIGMAITHSSWFFGPYGFVAKDGVLYSEPIPCKGQLGFFKVDIEQKR